jgi:hypothetical protein
MATSVTKAPSVNDTNSTKTRAPKYTAPVPPQSATSPGLVAPQKAIEPPPVC